MVDMAVDSFSGSDANGGADWNDELATLTAAFAAASSGDTIYLRNSNGGGFLEQFGGDATFSGPTAVGSRPIRIIAVLSTTTNWPPQESDLVVDQLDSDVAVLENTGNNDIRSDGFNYWRGAIVKAGAFFNDSRSQCSSIFEKCQIHYGVVAGGSRYIYIGATSSPAGPWTLTLIDTDIVPSAADDAIANFHRGAKLIWRGGSVLGSSVNEAFVFNEGGSAEVFGVNMSIITGTIVSVPASAEVAIDALFHRCTVNALATKVVNNAPMSIGRVRFLECDSVDNVNNAEISDNEGDVFNDTGITMVGGYSAYSADYSLKFVTTANVVPIIRPLRYLVGKINVDLSSVRTFVIPFVHDSATPLDNTQIWPELEIISQSSTLGQIISGRVSSILSTPAVHSASTETWNNTQGMTSENKQEMSISTPISKHSVVYVYACLAELSYAAYIGKVSHS